MDPTCSGYAFPISPLARISSKIGISSAKCSWALHGSFFNKNSSRATQPPPTRTITVLRRIRTKRSFWLSPNLYLPSPTWNTLNFCLHVHNITKRLTSSWIFWASWSGAFSSQSGRRAAINFFQSIKPRLFSSNMSATCFISSLEVSNLVLIMPLIKSSLGISSLLSLSILRNKSVNLDFL